MKLLVFLALLGVTLAQYEKGHVKILEDKRYQDGGRFGNYRDQEDGIKYFEETSADGIRRGFWEYPDPTGNILRFEFEAGGNRGFVITKSNVVDPTPQVQPQPQYQPAPLPLPQPQRPVIQQGPAQETGFRPLTLSDVSPHLTRRVSSPPQQRVQTIHAPRPTHPPTTTTTTTTTPAPWPRHHFDYPANLEFARTADGHRFVFTAL